MASSDEFKWEGGSSWEEEINESNGFGMKNGNVTIARPPEAAVSVDVSTGDLDTTFSFDATGTTDPTDTSISYEWAFGDGTTKNPGLVTQSLTRSVLLIPSLSHSYRDERVREYRHSLGHGHCRIASANGLVHRRPNNRKHRHDVLV